MSMREYIINNFKEDSIDSIKSSIEDCIASNEEDPLFGLGVLFELAWKNSNDEFKQNALNNIKKALN